MPRLKKGQLALINEGTEGLAAASALDTVIQLLITALAGIFPWTNLPIVSWIVRSLLTVAINKVFDLIKAWFGIDILPLIVGKELEAYNAAKVVFENLPENASEDQIQKAKEQFNKDFSALIRVRIYGMR